MALNCHNLFIFKSDFYVPDALFAHKLSYISRMLQKTAIFWKKTNTAGGKEISGDHLGPSLVKKFETLSIQFFTFLTWGRILRLKSALYIAFSALRAPHPPVTIGHGEHVFHILTSFH